MGSDVEGLSTTPRVGRSGSSGGAGHSGGPGLGERASDTVGAKAQGNPLAAGLVAFGVGMLASALIPASEKETRLASRAVDAAQEHGAPLVDQATSVGQDIAGELKESATESVQQVKATAQDSAQTVKAEGQSSAETVKNDATPS